MAKGGDTLGNFVATTAQQSCRQHSQCVIGGICCGRMKKQETENGNGRRKQKVETERITYATFALHHCTMINYDEWLIKQNA